MRARRRLGIWPVTAAASTLLLAQVAAGEPASLDATLTPYLARYQLPALAAAVVRDGRIIAAGAVGTRRAGTQTPVTRDDRFHLGSDTKAMTALLAAMLVEEGRLRWDTTVGEVFPELVARMAPGRREVTLTQLLSHTSGEGADTPATIAAVEQAGTQAGNLDALRAWLVGEWVAQPLAGAPGTTFTYANMNYVLAGAMIERRSGRTWDELIVERIFTPLALASAGLGAQSSLGRVDAPLGHALVDGTPVAFLAGPDGDNPPVIGPAGIAHMSVLDFARWAAWNAGGGRRAPALVRPETLATLHTPVVRMPPRPDAAPGTPSGGAYALGWGQVEVEWAAVPLLYHGGSNGKNLAHIWVEPGRDTAMVVMTNVASAQADAAFLALAADLYRTYLAPDAPTPAPEPTATARPRPSAAPLRRPGAGFSGDTRRGKGL